MPEFHTLYFLKGQTYRGIGVLKPDALDFAPPCLHLPAEWSIVNRHRPESCRQLKMLLLFGDAACVCLPRFDEGYFHIFCGLHFMGHKSFHPKRIQFESSGKKSLRASTNLCTVVEGSSFSGLRGS